MVDGETFELKLCDFGSTRVESGEGPFTEYVSTRWYRAPECILTSGSYGKSVDVWAVGCIMFELLSGHPLFPGKNEIDQIARIHNVCGSPSDGILHQFLENPNTQIPFQFPPRIPKPVSQFIPSASPDVCNLITCLIEYNPKDRITAQDALNHNVFKSFRDAEEKWKAANSPGPFPLFYAQCEFGSASSSRSDLPSATSEFPSPQSDFPSPKSTINPKAELSLSKNGFPSGKSDASSARSDDLSSKGDLPSGKSDHLDSTNPDSIQFQKPNGPSQPLMVFNQKVLIPQNPTSKPFMKVGNTHKPGFTKKPFVLKSEQLVESRKKAALRVQEYKQKQKPSVSKHPTIHQSYFPQGPKFVKPQFH